MSKGIMTVLLHQIEYDAGNVILDESTEETLHDIIANDIDLEERSSGTDMMDLEDEDENGKPIEVTVSWKIINPEADKWEEIASKLYRELKGYEDGDQYTKEIMEEYEQLKAKE